MNFVFQIRFSDFITYNQPYSKPYIQPCDIVYGDKNGNKIFV